MSRSMREPGAWQVVMNGEGRHSVWPAGSALPPGWHSRGEAESRAAALARVEQLWRDPRPQALREAMDTGRAGETHE